MITILLSFLITISNNTNPKSTKPCQVKCKIPDQYEETWMSYAKYIGSDDSDYTRERTCEVHEEGEKWVKKKADPSCISSNPDDCVVWCLVKTLTDTIHYTEVTDTVLEKRFVMDSIMIKRQLVKKAHKAYVDAPCKDELTDDLYLLIENQLIALGYTIDETQKRRRRRQLNQAIADYQLDHNLPRGKINIATLEALSIY